MKFLFALAIIAAGLAFGTGCKSSSDQPPSVDLTPGYVAPMK